MVLDLHLRMFSLSPASAGNDYLVVRQVLDLAPEDGVPAPAGDDYLVVCQVLDLAPKDGAPPQHLQRRLPCSPPGA